MQKKFGKEFGLKLFLIKIKKLILIFIFLSEGKVFWLN